MDKTHNVRFVCTGKSARSVIGEGLVNELGQGRFRVHSAGSYPKGAVHPIRRRIELMLALPLAALGRMAIRKEIRDIASH